MSKHRIHECILVVLVLLMVPLYVHAQEDECSPDTFAPVLYGCPLEADVYVPCGSQLPPYGDVGATDNCDGSLVPVFTELISPDGKTITRSWTATDQAGNSASCSQRITINDNTPPQITCPGDISVEATSNAGADADFTPVSTDNCSIVLSECSNLPGSTFPLGETTVTCTAFDNA